MPTKFPDLTETTRELLLAKYPRGAWGIKDCAARIGSTPRAITKFREGHNHTMLGTTLQALYEDLTGKPLLKSA